MDLIGRALMPLLLLVIASLTLEATAAGTFIDTKVYRVTDEQGNITFTDQPEANSGVIEQQRVSVINLMRAPMPPKPDDNSAAHSLVVNSGSAASASSIQPYTQAIIVSPIEGSTLRNTAGAMTIELSLIPQLQTGHRVQLWVDGQRYGSAIKATTLHVANIERGPHQLICRVLNADGRPVAITAAVSVHVKRPFNRGSR
jgi:hypothetical protein